MGFHCAIKQLILHTTNTKIRINLVSFFI
jgi:hypothetical protein